MRLATIVLLLWASSASALTAELRWTHPEPERIQMIYVLADGGTIAEVPALDLAPAGDVQTTRVVVPFGADIQLIVQDGQGETSPPSGVQVYGDQCADFDSNGDGIIGGPDFTAFMREWQMGTAITAEWSLFRGYYGQTCG